MPSIWKVCTGTVRNLSKYLIFLETRVGNMKNTEKKVRVATLRQKGLTTEVREILKIAAGDRILFMIEHDSTVVLKKALVVSAE